MNTVRTRFHNDSVRRIAIIADPRLSARENSAADANRSFGSFAIARTSAQLTCSGTSAPRGARARHRIHRVAHQHLAHRAAGVRRVPGQHLVHHAGEAVQVAAPVEIVRADRLFGAHVHRRAERDPRLRDRRVLGRALHPRDPEIGHDGDAALEEDVLRLDVAVDDPLVVRPLERAGHLDADAHGRVDGELPLAPDPVAQRLAAHVRHHVVQQAARLARVVAGRGCAGA